MTRQSAEFIAREGDAWFARNEQHLAAMAGTPSADPVVFWVTQHPRPTESILEVGCSNGWRLAALKQNLGGNACGVEPSGAAIEAGKSLHPDLDLRRGTADKLPFDDRSFDLVVYGFCLYLCDRANLFRIAAEADRVLRPEGSIIIYDFDPLGPAVTPYRHLPGVSSYRFDYVEMFRWHPAYELVGGFVCPHPGETSWDAASRVVVAEITKTGLSG